MAGEIWRISRWAWGGPQLGVPSLFLPAPLPPWAPGQEGYQLGLQPGLVILNGGKRCFWPGRGRGCGPGRPERSEVGCVWQGVCAHCWGVHLGVGVTGSVCDSSSGWRLGIQAGFVGCPERLPPIPPSTPIPDHVFTAEGGGGWRRGRGDTFPARYLDVQPPSWGETRPQPAFAPCLPCLRRVHPACARSLLGP